MSTSLDERCPRCRSAFHCGIGDEGPCACTGVTLDATRLEDLRQRYSGCLCLPCLQALATEAPVSPAPCG